jgi:lipid II:glycine glycyltransferase (peptidoglycan interpeptide bridge formation enzyme)
MPDDVVKGFQRGLSDMLRDRGVISVFSRLHPLIPQRAWIAGLGECRQQGQTVSIDLQASADQQRANYSGSVKSRLNRLRRNGLSGERDAKKSHLAEFIEIYHETMRRVRASSAYFFEQEYFTKLVAALQDALQLFIVRAGDGQILCGGLFTLCDGIVQYHLGGTRSEALRLSPMCLLLDTVRLWANERHARVFHLGGGVGSNADSLFQFKATFSAERNPFATWRWILDSEAYFSLSEEHSRNLVPHNQAATPAYFPAYRAPGITDLSLEAAMFSHELISSHG